MSDVYDYDDEPILPDDDDPHLAAADEEPAEPVEPGSEPIEPVEPQPRRRRTASDEIRALRQRAQTAERGLEDLRSQFTQLRSGPLDTERQRREAEEFALLPPEEQTRRRQEQFEQKQTIILGEVLDQSRWSAIVAREPQASRMADEVERTLAQERNQGRNWTREQVYNQLLAQQMRQRSTQAADRQRRAGARRIQEQTTRPPAGGRSGAPSGAQRREVNDRAERRARLMGSIVKRGPNGQLEYE